MLIVQDKFFEEETFKKLQEYCNQEFTIHTIGKKQYSLLPTPKDILPLLKIKGFDIVTSFIRSAYKGFDNDLRVHADNIIDNKKISFASVIYINKEQGVTPNGTCLYKHHIHGHQLPENVSEEEFNRLIEEDANDESKWVKTDVINSIPNRYVMYDANYFHGKFPKEIGRGVRKVLVTFHAKSNTNS